MEVFDSKPVYRLDSQLEIDASQCCLRLRGEEQYLRQQAFELLVYLIEQRDRTVSKEELNQKIWKGTAVTDSALAQCIFEIRKALGDDSREPRFIRTVPKLGYRFIGNVEELRNSAKALAVKTSSELATQEDLSPVTAVASGNRYFRAPRAPQPVVLKLSMIFGVAAISFLCCGLFWSLSRPAITEASIASGFENAMFPEQHGTFTVVFDATPSDFPINSTIGLANKQVLVNRAMAVIVRFNIHGYIDARNGKTYTADSAIPYTAGVKHHFRLVVDMPAHRYSAYVTPAGGQEKVIGTNLSFRDHQDNVSELNSVGVWSSSATDTVCNFSLANAPSSTDLGSFMRSFLRQHFYGGSNSPTILAPCP